MSRKTGEINGMIPHSHLEDREIDSHKVASKGFSNGTWFELRRGCWVARKPKGVQSGGGNPEEGHSLVGIR